MAWTIYAMLLQKKTTLITKSSGTLAGIVITRRDIVPRLGRKTRPFICLPPLHGITPSFVLRRTPPLRNYYSAFRPPGACLLEAITQFMPRYQCKHDPRIAKWGVKLLWWIEGHSMICHRECGDLTITIMSFGKKTLSFVQVIKYFIGTLED